MKFGAEMAVLQAKLQNSGKNWSHNENTISIMIYNGGYNGLHSTSVLSCLVAGFFNLFILICDSSENTYGDNSQLLTSMHSSDFMFGNEIQIANNAILLQVPSTTWLYP